MVEEVAMTVYADVLLAVNYVVNLLLLAGAARLLGALPGRKRVCLGALLGAAGSLAIFFPPWGPFRQLLYQLCLCAGMAGIVFGMKPYQRLLRGIVAVTAVNFLFAGAMLALQFSLEPGGMVLYNGIVYFNVPALQLVFWTAFSYGLLTLLERLFSKGPAQKKLYRVTVDAGGCQISFDALADTGNTLKEPFSGAPVIVCDGTLAATLPVGESSRLRLIPCSTVTGGGALQGFRPDGVTISWDGREYRTKDVYIAGSKEPIEGTYRAVFNPVLLEK